MKRLFLLAAAAVLGCACAHTRAGEATAQASSSSPSATNVQPAGEAPLPGQAQPIYDNAQVRVSRLSISPGQRVTMPDTPNEMMYSLQDCSLRLESADGRTWDLNTKKDQVIWSDAAQRGAAATGDHACDLVLVEVKRPAAGAAGQGAAATPSGGVQTSP